MTLFPVILSLVGATLVPADSTHCVAAAHFLRESRRMVAEVEPDTINDWRTGKRVAGCRITAAGATDGSVQQAASQLYDALRGASWSRTPDPRDAPNEASLRFRHEHSDCLFNVNAEAMLFTDAEARVNEALILPPGQTRYQVFVICLPAMVAKPRDPAVAGPHGTPVLPTPQSPGPSFEAFMMFHDRY